MRKPLAKTFIFIIVAAIFFAGYIRLASACGPFSRYAIFAYSKHPDFPLNKFASGEIGVIEPSYARSYLFVAYRLMKGGNFNEREQEALSSLWNARLDFSREEQQEDNSLASWLVARKKVTGNNTEPKIDVYRPKTQNQYDFFLNCHPDAFRNAAAVLEERIAKFGAESAEVKDWLLAQDMVFTNCAGGQSIPVEASSSAARLVQDDRSYQIAAAHFYAMNFDEARSRFEKIASDTASVWREQAQYLVARSLIRKASLGAEANRHEALAQAETQLKKVLSEANQSALRQSAQNLLSLVKLRLRPEERIRELAQSLLKKEANEQFKQELLDYTILLDKYLGDADEPLDENAKKALDAAGKDDLTDWLITYQAETKDALAHSLEKWEQTNDLPWLISSLSKVKASHTKAAALMLAAERVGDSSPAFVTARFHLVRLLLENGDRAGAKRTLDAILQKRSTLPASSLNKFLQQRMLVASTLEEFLQYAQRKPAAFSWDEDGREVPIDVKEDDELKVWTGRSLLDADSTRILNEQFPLAVLREAAASQTLPEHIRRQIALAAWTRAAIMDDAEAGKALAPIASALAPELKTYLDDYLSATTPAARKAAALYTILKFPGLHLTVVPGLGRLTPINERDSYRDNWWCALAETTVGSADKNTDSEEADAQLRQSTSRALIEPSFLSETQKAAARRERVRLLALGTAPNYLSREAIAWANRTPNDARVPEALHIAVTATRYGCTDRETGRWSKAAFQLLHRRYPKSEWTKKTPYWFSVG